MQAREVSGLVERWMEHGGVIDVRRAQSDEDENEMDPWILPLSRKGKDEFKITGPLPKVVKITIANMIFVETGGLPS